MFFAQSGLKILNHARRIASSPSYISKRSIGSSSPRLGGGSFFQKNKFIEEWNGTREITEKTWTIDGSNAVSLIVSLIVFPTFCYSLMKSELAEKYRKEGRDVDQL